MGVRAWWWCRVQRADKRSALVAARREGAKVHGRGRPRQFPKRVLRLSGARPRAKACGAAPGGAPHSEELWS